jgi:hypothetical protein
MPFVSPLLYIFGAFCNNQWIYNHKLKWVIETSDVCTWQIIDDTRRQVYCALIKLLQDKNLSVRVCCMCPCFFCTSPLLLVLHGYGIFLSPNSVLLYPLSTIEVLHPCKAGSLSVFVRTHWRCKLFKMRIYWSSSNMLGFML